MNLEHRSVPFEVKSVDVDGSDLTFEGYGSVFGTVDSYGDTIEKGAFGQSLREWKKRGKLPKMLLQHGGGFFGSSADDLIPVGKYAEMREDDYGLFVRGRVFGVDTDRVKAMSAAMREGELDGLSIGFNVRDAKNNDETGGRNIKRVGLWEVSLVTFPANDPARVSEVRADEMTEREFERFLREAGFSANAAKCVVAKGFKALREAPPEAIGTSPDVVAAFLRQQSMAAKAVALR